MSERRTFLAALGVVPLAPAVFAQTAPAPPNPAPAPSPSATPAADPAVDALAGLIEKRYGAFLDADQKKEVRAALEWNQEAAKELRKLKLGNADEPVTVFEARPPRVRARRT